MIKCFTAEYKASKKIEKPNVDIKEIMEFSNLLKSFDVTRIVTDIKVAITIVKEIQVDKISI